MGAMSADPPQPSEQSPPTPVRYQFFGDILRHWRGELPLWRSVGVNLMLFASALFVLVALTSHPYSVVQARLHLLAVLCLLMVVPWALVGAWRAAARSARATRLLARVAVALVVGVALGGAVTLKPLLIDTTLAALEREVVPPYSLTIVGDGTELSLDGGFRMGVALAVQRMLQDHPEVRVLRLTSPGGRMAEALRLAGYLTDAHLATYVPSHCDSACAVAFLSGQPRLLRNGARIGFHVPALPNGDQPNAIRESARLQLALELSGISQDFAQLASSIPHNDLWSPPAQVLVAAHVVDQVVTGEQFAPPTPVLAPEPEAVAGWMSQQVALRVLSEVDPPAFAQLLSDTMEQAAKGDSLAQLEADLDDRFGPIMLGYLTTAPDAEVIAFTESIIERLAYLYEDNPLNCFRFLLPEKWGSIEPEMVPKGMQERRRESITNVIRVPEVGPALEPGLSERLLRQVITQLKKEMGEQAVEALSHPDGEGVPATTYCPVILRFYQTLLALPEVVRGGMLRHVYGLGREARPRLAKTDP